MDEWSGEACSQMGQKNKGVRAQRRMKDVGG
jgi:hypothetical protein